MEDSGRLAAHLRDLVTDLLTVAVLAGIVVGVALLLAAILVTRRQERLGAGRHRSPD